MPIDDGRPQTSEISIRWRCQVGVEIEHSVHYHLELEEKPSEIKMDLDLLLLESAASACIIATNDRLGAADTGLQRDRSLVGASWRAFIKYLVQPIAEPRQSNEEAKLKLVDLADALKSDASTS